VADLRVKAATSGQVVAKRTLSRHPGGKSVPLAGGLAHARGIPIANSRTFSAGFIRLS